MALVIRMRQQGAKNRQTYRVVVTDVRSPRDGKYIEKLGWYNPFAEGEKSLQLNAERLQHWLNMGAQVSESVQSLVQRSAPDVMKQQTAKKVARMEKARVKRKKK